ncbi:MAG: BACON domain-containing protein [Blastocatellia bacterium]
MFSFRIRLFCPMVLLYLLATLVPAQTSLPGRTVPPDKRAAAQASLLSNPEKAARGQAPLFFRHPDINPGAAPQYRLAAPDAALLRDTTNDYRRPRQIGAFRALPQAPVLADDMAQYQLPEGRLSLARIVSTGAQSLRLQFINMAMAAGARLFVYATGDPAQFAGPYAGRGPGGDGELWTGSLPGEDLTIEYFVPQQAFQTEAQPGARALPFTLRGVMHGFLNHRNGAIGYGAAAGNCNLDVPAEWNEAARSTGLLRLVKGNFEYSCSGVMLNHNSSGGGSFFLTAGHCVGSAREARYAEVYWYIDRNIAPPNGQRVPVAFLATNTLTDLTLLRMSNLDAGQRLSGWNAQTPAAGTPVTTIHHPSGSYKRISQGTVNNDACPAPIPAALCGNLIKTRWNAGVTEPGSSGAPLWTGPASDPRVTGALSGGLSSCASPNGTDVFGRLDLIFPAISYYLTGAGCTYQLTETESFIGAAGGAAQLELTAVPANATCPWTVTSDVPWITFPNGASGNGGVLRYAVAAHTNTGPRIGTLTINGQTYTVNQTGGSAGCSPRRVQTGFFYEPTLAAGSCRSAVIPDAPADRFILDAQTGQQIRLTMSANDFDSVLALYGPDGNLIEVSDDADSFYSLIPYRPPQSVSYYTIPATGTYTIECTTRDEDTGPYRLQIDRGCVCALTPAQASIPQPGGTGSFNIAAPPDCAWRLEGIPAWVTVAPLSGQGNGALNYTVTANPTVAGDTGSGPRGAALSFRVGNNTVAFFQISQAPICGFSVNAGSKIVGNLGRYPDTLNVNTAHGCPWTGTSNAPWLGYLESFQFLRSTISFTGPGSAMYTATKVNLGNASRTGTITVAGFTHTVTQVGIGAACQIRPMSIGQTVSGSHGPDCLPLSSEPGYPQRAAYHSFNGTAGQKVAISLTANDPDVAMTLIDPNDEPVNSLGIYGGADRRRYPERGFWTLPLSGRYVIAVGAGHGNGSSPAGRPVDYFLSVSESTGTGCELNATPATRVFTAAAGTSKITLTQGAGSGCAWTATSTAPWLTVSPASGTGAGEITLTAAANTGAARTGMVTVGGQHILITQQQTAVMAAVSAGDYSRRYGRAAITSLFGSGLSTQSAAAQSQPLPKTLGGVTVRLIDQTGLGWPADLFYVSPTQINFLIPTDVPAGPAQIVVTSGATASATEIVVEDTAPAMFTADSSGRGYPAALLYRLSTQTYEPVVRYDQAGRVVPIALDYSNERDGAFLILFGTGIRGHGQPLQVTVDFGGTAGQVLFAGQQSSFAGLDQINVLIPRSLRGRGDVTVNVTVNGKAANPVTLRFGGSATAGP